MSTRRKPFRSQWAPTQPEPKTEPVDSARVKALRLPRFGPGILISIPLHLLPAYLEIYQLQPAGVKEPPAPRRDGPGEAILLVKRVKPEESAH